MPVIDVHTCLLNKQRLELYQVMYGSDYPHNIGDMKGCLGRVDAPPAAQRDAVRGGNAQRIFRPRCR